MPRQSVTVSQHTTAYQAGRDVYDKIKTNKQALDELVIDHGLNLGTAIAFISAFRHLSNGEKFTRGMSDEAMTYFMSQIQRERGPEALEQAVKSIRAHLVYWRDDIKKGNFPYWGHLQF